METDTPSIWSKTRNEGHGSDRTDGEISSVTNPRRVLASLGPGDARLEPWIEGDIRDRRRGYAPTEMVYDIAERDLEHFARFETSRPMRDASELHRPYFFESVMKYRREKSRNRYGRPTIEPSEGTYASEGLGIGH